MLDIHPTAVVDRSAELAEGVRIGAYCIVGPQVTIGKGTELRSHVVIESHTRIGAECTLFPFACIGGTPQDRKFQGEVTWCEIGDRNHLREYVTIHRGTANGGGVTKVGNNNLLMVSAHLAHDVILGNSCTIANEVMIAGHVSIEDGVTVAGGTGVHHFVTIGKRAMVAGLARVERDVPPYMVFGGAPATVRLPNKIGMSRCGFSDPTIKAMREAYRLLFARKRERQRHAGETIEDRMDHLRRVFADVPPVIELVEFHARSLKAGVSGRYLETHRRDDKHAKVSHTSGAASIRS